MKGTLLTLLMLAHILLSYYPNTNLSFGGESQGRPPVVHYLAGKSCGEPGNDPRPNPSSSLAPSVGNKQKSFVPLKILRREKMEKLFDLVIIGLMTQGLEDLGHRRSKARQRSLLGKNA